MLTQRNYIGGEWVEPRTGETFYSLDPATAAPIAEVPRSGGEDVDLAVTAAREALESSEWREISPVERGRLMLRIAGAIRENAEELARWECLDSGKPLRDARNDVIGAARYFEYYSGVVDKYGGRTIPFGPRYTVYTLREPIGITAHIVPWNYPMTTACRSIAAAIAMGNTVVAKPAEQTPITALKLAELATRAGLPKGVFNVVTGFGPESGAPLAAHPGVNHISFTGSVETGQIILQLAAKNVTPVSLELGGKSPNIVFADADLAQALEGAIRAIFTNAGQMCSAGSRLFVEQSCHEPFLRALKDRAEQLTIGPGIEDPDLGPVISEEQRERVLSYIEIGRKEGAVVATGGGPPSDARLRKGYFIAPTILDRVENGMRVAQEEIFGPVLTVLTFRTLDEVATLANTTDYGLAAGIYTRDVSKAHRLAAEIKAGHVYINDYLGGGAEFPFGGYKKSGYGRERGLEGLENYTQIKTVFVRIR